MKNRVSTNELSGKGLNSPAIADEYKNEKTATSIILRSRLDLFFSDFVTVNADLTRPIHDGGGAAV